MTHAGKWTAFISLFPSTYSNTPIIFKLSFMFAFIVNINQLVIINIETISNFTKTLL